jgi:hypothetical protein
MTPHVLHAKRRVQSRHVKRPERDEQNLELPLCHHEEVAAEASVGRSGQSNEERRPIRLDSDGHYLPCAGNSLFEPFMHIKRSFCQDSLGTNIGGKHSKKSGCVFLQLRWEENLPAKLDENQV